MKIDMDLEFRDDIIPAKLTKITMLTPRGQPGVDRKCVESLFLLLRG